MMRSTLVLTAHSWRRVRVIVGAMAVVLAGFQFLLTQVAVVLERNQAFGALSSIVPDFMSPAIVKLPREPYQEMFSSLTNTPFLVGSAAPSHRNAFAVYLSGPAVYWPGATAG